MLERAQRGWTQNQLQSENHFFAVDVGVVIAAIVLLYERWNENKAIINRINDLFPSNKSILYLQFVGYYSSFSLELCTWACVSVCVCTFYVTMRSWMREYQKLNNKNNSTAIYFDSESTQTKRNENKQIFTLFVFKTASQSIRRPNR